MKKVLAMVLIVLTIFSFLSFAVTATGIEPRWNNTASTMVSLYVNSSGKASVTCQCIGINGVTTGITAETKIERKWGILWLDVDGAEWTDTTTSSDLVRTHEIQLTKTGTYRATTKFTVTGSGGSSDSIKCTSEDTYE